jgi:hypothetical protein
MVVLEAGSWSFEVGVVDVGGWILEATWEL